MRFFEVHAELTGRFRDEDVRRTMAETMQARTNPVVYNMQVDALSFT